VPSASDISTQTLSVAYYLQLAYIPTFAIVKAHASNEFRICYINGYVLPIKVPPVGSTIQGQGPKRKKWVVIKANEGEELPARICTVLQHAKVKFFIS